MLRVLHALVFALAAVFVIASGAHAVGSETALRKNFELAHGRVGGLALEAGGTRQQNASHGTAVASECSYAARGGDIAARIGSSFGPNSVGAAQRILGKIVQTGGNKINRATADAMNKATGSALTPREWGRGLEALKKELDLANNHHGKITEYGHYLDEAGEVLGNILEFL